MTKTLDQVIEEHFKAVLEECNYNRTLTAKKLKISVRTVRDYARKYKCEKNPSATNRSVKNTNNSNFDLDYDMHVKPKDRDEWLNRDRF